MSRATATILVLLLIWSGAAIPGLGSLCCCPKDRDCVAKFDDCSLESVKEDMPGHDACRHDYSSGCLTFRCAPNSTAESVYLSESKAPERVTQVGAQLRDRDFSVLSAQLVTSANTSPRAGPMEPLLQSCSFLS